MDIFVVEREVIGRTFVKAIQRKNRMDHRRMFTETSSPADSKGGLRCSMNARSLGSILLAVTRWCGGSLARSEVITMFQVTRESRLGDFHGGVGIIGDVTNGDRVFFCK